ncbi:hypothetical protein OROGR_020297 [Orobanche gracilis]
MPQKRFIADALSVVTIFLVVILVLLGLFCIIYTLYLRNRIRSQGLVRLNYFSGPWIIRITYIFFALWWGVGEILRLELLRRNGRISGALSLIWQENVCKCCIVSNLGFSEPCMFLTLTFLLHASLQRSGTLSPMWNAKTAGFVLLYSFPMVVLQLVLILVGPKYKDKLFPKLPSYFVTAVAFSNTNDHTVALCTYPLFSTIFLGLFATMLTGYLFWLGRRILNLVINKGLQKRVYTLVFSISSLFPLRVLLLGLSVLVTPKNAAFDAVVFLSFLSSLCCAFMGIYILVYLPISDSLASRGRQRDLEGRTIGEYDATHSLIDSETCGSISFRVKEKDEASEDGFVELNLFSPSHHPALPESPRALGWPMIPLPEQGQES